MCASADASADAAADAADAADSRPFFWPRSLLFMYFYIVSVSPGSYSLGGLSEKTGNGAGGPDREERWHHEGMGAQCTMKMGGGRRWEAASWRVH